MICDLRFESQIPIAIKSRDLEHFVWCGYCDFWALWVLFGSKFAVTALTLETQETVAVIILIRLKNPESCNCNDSNIGILCVSWLGKSGTGSTNRKPYRVRNRGFPDHISHPITLYPPPPPNVFYRKIMLGGGRALQLELSSRGYRAVWGGQSQMQYCQSPETH